MEALSSHPKEKRNFPQGDYSVITLSNPNNVNRGGDYKPVIVAPGWGITLKTEGKFLQGMVDAGKDVTALDFSRNGGKVEENGDGIRAETARKAEAYADHMRSLPSGKYDLFGQSEGTMVILAALIRHPDLLDKVGNVVFKSSAGLTDNDSFVKLLVRYIGGHAPQDIAHLLGAPINSVRHSGGVKKWGKDFAKRIVGHDGEGKGKGNVVNMTNEATKYIGKNPVRALKEANTIAHGGFYDFVELLHERGINFAFIQGESDKLTPAKALWEKMGEGYQDATMPSPDTTSELQYLDNKFVPPPASVTMVGGGHDNRVYAEAGFAAKVVREFDMLDSKAENEKRWASPDNPNNGVNYDKWKKAKQQLQS